MQSSRINDGDCSIMTVWDKARQRILERDDYTCQLCGSKNLALCVHHLRRDGSRDDSRLITLCSDCHQELHRSTRTWRTDDFQPDGHFSRSISPSIKSSKANKSGDDGEMFWAGRGFGRGAWTERTSPVEFLILLLLNEESTHGYDIIQRLSEKFSGLWSPKPGTVYPALTRLDEKGLIRLKETEIGRPSEKSEAEYPPKKVYVLTEKGMETLKNVIGKMDFEEKMIDRFMGMVDHSVWLTFDNMAVKRIEGAIERALSGASEAVRGAIRVLSPEDGLHELEFYRDQLKAELETVESKMTELKEREKKYRKVNVE